MACDAMVPVFAAAVTVAANDVVDCGDGGGDCRSDPPSRWKS